MNTVEPIRDLAKIDAIKKLLKGQNIRDWMLFTFGVNSALRISDLLKLRQMDILDEKGKTLEYMKLRETKTNKGRLFKLNDTIIKAIKEYIPKDKYDPNAYLFPSRKGQNKPIDRKHAWEIITNAARAVDVKENIRYAWISCL
jgi:integrase